MSKTTTQLTSWRWRMANSNGNAKAESLPSLAEWTPVASFPSVVQMELLAQKLIPDPNIGENERLIQWAGAVDWEYACSFDSPKTADGQFADLVFEGLDTFATVTLNGKEVLRSDNMFIPHRVGVKEALRPPGERNELAILFESAEKIGAKLEKANGYLKCIMRDARRNHMRKAQANQYNWGWDWGPIVVTAGPYLPVSLESYGTRIDNVHIVPKLADDLKSASISTTITVSPKSTAAAATVDIVDAVGAKVATASVDLKDREQGSVDIKIDSPKLWWCNGQGEAHLYTAEVAITGSDSTILDKSSTRFGVRTIEVIQRPLDKEPGLTFMFRVNGRDIFAQGGDWIPADNMIPRITRQRYFDWAEVAKYCHLNMIRVWGGGIYETEDFFDACDENGLLVWHDMGFACTNTPVHDTFIESVRKEAEAQITRFRNRASLALICGGNEDFMLFDLEGIKYDHSDVTGPFDGQPFPQRKIYLDVLPKVAECLAPNVFYWANSPWGGAPANDPTVGDIHQWSVWHGEQKPYQEYKKLSGRLVSEFGMHGFPVQRTVDNFFPPDAPASVRHPQSRLVDCHNKGHGAHTRIARYLAENFRFDMADLENFVYSSQLMQTEAYACAMRDWKRLFQGPGRELCAGAIIWQLNDCYPVTSWAFVDFFLRPKPAFYAIRRACAPVSVGVERAPATRWVDEDRPESKVPRFALFGHNTGPEAVECVLALRAYDFETGRWTELSAEDASRPVTLAPGRNTELGALASQASWTEDSLVILEATLSDKSGNQLARAVDWPEPYRYLYWPDDTSVSVQVAPALAPSSHSAATAGGTGFFTDGGWEDRVTVSANQPVKGVWLEPVYDGSEKFDEYEPLWSDNMLDLMPGQEVGVLVKGLKGRKVKARFLADWEVKKGRE